MSILSGWKFNRRQGRLEAQYRGQMKAYVNATGLFDANDAQISGGGAGTPSGIQYVDVQLTNNQILHLNATPVELIPAIYENSAFMAYNDVDEWSGGNASTTISVRVWYMIVPSVSFGA